MRKRKTERDIYGEKNTEKWLGIVKAAQVNVLRHADSQLLEHVHGVYGGKIVCGDSLPSET